MQRHLIAASAAAFLLVPTLAFADSKVIDATGFTGIEIASGIRAEVGIGSTFSVVADSPRFQDLTELRTNVTGGVFHASYDWTFLDLLRPTGRDITLRITLPALQQIGVSSGALVTATAPAGDKLEIDVSSGSRATITAAASKTYRIDASSGASVTIDGSCTSLAANSSSGANLDAKALDCADVTANVSSGAHASVAARTSITADASSGGGIDVVGKPQVTALAANSGGTIRFAPN